jgi:hypothetical protein
VSEPVSLPEVVLNINSGVQYVAEALVLFRPFNRKYQASLLTPLSLFFNFNLANQLVNIRFLRTLRLLFSVRRLLVCLISST